MENAIEIMICVNAARNVGHCRRRGGGVGFSTFTPGGEDAKLVPGRPANPKNALMLLEILRKVAMMGFMANGDEEQRTG